MIARTRRAGSPAGRTGKGGRPRIGRPRIALFGDSHTVAIIEGREFGPRSVFYQHVAVHRLRKDKGNVVLGDTSLDDFCDIVADFGEDDFVFSAIGGNQYAVISMFSHEIDFDFFSGPKGTQVASEAQQIIPYRALRQYLADGVRGNDGKSLARLKQATKARVFHISPPPPKADNAFVANHLETRFRDEAIAARGPARPSLRLKVWQVQDEVLRQLCDELGMELLPPPPEALDAEGFLIPHYYGRDATHANRRYGELVLRQILTVTDTVPKGGFSAEPDAEGKQLAR